MEIAGHLWQFLTKNKTLRLRNHSTVTSPLADSFVVSNPRQCPAIYQQYFFFEIIKIIFHGDCWSFMAIPDSNKTFRLRNDHTVTCPHSGLYLRSEITSNKQKSLRNISFLKL